VGLLILYAVLVTPVEIAFNVIPFPRAEHFNLFVSFVFMLDVVVTFRTTVPVSATDPTLLVEPISIAHRYVFSWFIVDLLSSIPFDLFMSALGFVRILRLFRLFRLARLGKVFKLARYIDAVEDVTGLPPATFDLITMLVQVYFIAHLMTCIWWGLCDTASEAGQQWYSNKDLVYADLTQSPVAIRYVAALYWTFTTMSTIGYGYVKASLHSHHVIAVACPVAPIF
jgi:hypothetical protein